MFGLDCAQFLEYDELLNPCKHHAIGDEMRDERKKSKNKYLPLD